MQNKKTINICIWVLFIIYLFSFLLTTSSDFTQDLGRHLKLGEIIVQTKSVPKTNLFSYTHPDFPFINHHWLSEVIFFLAKRWMGLNSLITLKACVICLALCITVASSMSIWGIGVGFIVSPLILERADIRPELFGFLFFSLLLVQFQKTRKGGNISSFLPFIFLLWVNTHISFVFGLLLLGAICIVAHKNKRTILIILLCFISLFINPNGILGVLAPFTIFDNYGYSIAENQNMFFLLNKTNSIFIRGYLLLLPVIFVCVYLLIRQKKYTESSLLSMFALCALYQVRHLPFFVLTALVFVPDCFKNVHMHFSQTLKALVRYVFIFLLFGGIIFFGSGFFFELFDINKTFGWGFELADTKVITFLKKNPQKGHIFNNFDIGSYLSFGLYPHTKVFVDGRPEAYPASFFQDVYIPLENEQKKQDLYFTQFDIHTIVVSHTDQTSWAQTFLSRIARDNKWKLIFFDSFFAVFTDKREATDIRDTSVFMRQIENETDFFKLAYYVHFLEVLGRPDVSISILNKMNTIRPHSCLLIRLRKAENDAPWCY